MSFTHSTQSHLFGYSGTTGWEEGDGVNTREALDLVKMLNNLWYTGLPVGYVQAPTGYVEASLETVVANEEVYVGQVPTLVPVGSKRLAFTVGASAFSIGFSTTIAAINAYLVSNPYTGDGSPTSFDHSKLPPGYVSTSVTLTTTVTGGVSAYSLCVSTTGITPVSGWYGILPDVDRGAYVVLTCTGNGGYQSTVRVYDFAWWLPPE